MSTVLIVYGTTHGHTRKVAQRIAEVLEREGLTADLHEVAAAAALDLRDYDGVIVGGSVHAGHHQHELVEWARHHARALNGLSGAFFSVCLTAADDTDESRTATREYIDDFLDDTGWTPTETVSFAGALQYREYDFMTRLLMRMLMRRGDHPTDVTRDYDYTDWDAVEAFAKRVAAISS
jgi:menaquinone-dependent protoporphyrinogen oxidase